MVRITSKVTLRRRGNLANHIAKIEKAVSGPTKIKVGLPAGKSDPGIVQIAIWQHFGTAGSGTNFATKGIGNKTFGGFGGPIPARPFLTVAMYKFRASIRRDLRKIAESITVNGKPLQPALGLLGEKAKGHVQATISAGVGPPNAPLTIAIKGSSKQLIHEGNMWGALTWAFDYGSGGAGAGLRKGAK